MDVIFYEKSASNIFPSFCLLSLSILIIISNYLLSIALSDTTGRTSGSISSGGSAKHKLPALERDRDRDKNRDRRAPSTPPDKEDGFEESVLWSQDSPTQRSAQARLEVFAAGGAPLLPVYGDGGVSPTTRSPTASTSIGVGISTGVGAVQAQASLRPGGDRERDKDKDRERERVLSSLTSKGRSRGIARTQPVAPHKDRDRMQELMDLMAKDTDSSTMPASTTDAHVDSHLDTESSLSPVPVTVHAVEPGGLSSSSFPTPVLAVTAPVPAGDAGVVVEVGQEYTMSQLEEEMMQQAEQLEKQRQQQIAQQPHSQNPYAFQIAAAKKRRIAAAAAAAVTVAPVTVAPVEVAPVAVAPVEVAPVEVALKVPELTMSQMEEAMMLQTEQLEQHLHQQQQQHQHLSPQRSQPLSVGAAQLQSQMQRSPPLSHSQKDNERLNSIPLPFSSMSSVPTPACTLAPASATLASSSSLSSDSSPSIDILSYRFIALDVLDVVTSAVKIVQCFMPDGQPLAFSSLSLGGNAGAGIGGGGAASAGLSAGGTLEVHLREEWYATNLVGGDVFHIVDLGERSLRQGGHTHTNPVGESHADSCFLFSPCSAIPPIAVTTTFPLVAVVDNTRGVCVVHPDIMVTPSRIAEAVSCIRRAVISDRAAVGSVGQAATLGSLKHSFLEALLQTGYDNLAAQNKNKNQKVNRGGHMHVLGQQQQQQMQPLYDRKSVEALAAACIVEHVHDLSCSSLSDTEILAELMLLIEPAAHFVRKTSASGNASISLPGVGENSSNSNNNNHQNRNNRSVKDSSSGIGSNDNDTGYIISSVDSLEETIWCPALGIKGQADCLVLASKDNSQGDGNTANIVEVAEAGAENRYLMPLEIKTGKVSPFTAVGHRAQVMLYTLMLMLRGRTPVQRGLNLSERGIEEEGTPLFGSNCGPITTHGFLVYLNAETCKVDTISPGWPEVRGLLGTRNILAAALYKTITSVGSGGDSMVTSAGTVTLALPPLKQDRECEFCFQAAECMTNHAFHEGGDAVSSGVPTLFEYTTSGLTVRQAAYLRHWDRLVDLEAKATAGTTHQMWSMSSHSRMSQGDRCAAGLRLARCLTAEQWQKEQEEEPAQAAQEPKARYQKLRKQEQLDMTTQRLALVFEREAAVSEDTTLSPGDRIYISLEGDQPPPQLQHQKPAQIQMQGQKQGQGQNHVGKRNAPSSTHDIEDICKSRADPRTTLGYKFWSISQVEPALLSGSVVSASSTTVVVFTNGAPVRLLRLSGREPHISVRFRLDKDDSSVITARTMRSNLLSLFVKPFSPGAYRDFKQNGCRPVETASLMSSGKSVGGTKSSNNENSSGAEPDLQANLRGLIVDLLPPKFSLASSLGSSHLMFCPLGFPIREFNQAMKRLEAYMKSQNGNVSVSVSGIGSTGSGIGSTGSGNSVSRSDTAAGTLPIQRGPNGELYIGRLTVYPGCNPLVLYKEYYNLLNYDQKEAVKRVLLTKDYCLILGLPGTGKTTAMSLVIRALMARGEKVLLTSYTHTAVDNVLLKLAESGVSPAFAIRVGKAPTVNSALHSFLIDVDDDDNSSTLLAAAVDAGAARNSSKNSGGSRIGLAAKETVQQLRQRCDQARLVACTVLSAPRSTVVQYIEYADRIRYDKEQREKEEARQHPPQASAAADSTTSKGSVGAISSNPYLKTGSPKVRLGFQWCVMDEAGQISQPAALGPLLHSTSFVLVGDEYQLPPLVVSAAAQASGADVSLFKRLSEGHPEAVCCLSQQYRMNDDIMVVCNTLIYEQRMRCANASVARSRLQLPFLERTPPVMRHPSYNFNSKAMQVSGSSGRSDWLYQCMSPFTAVVFLNLDAVISSLPVLSFGAASVPSASGKSTGKEGMASSFSSNGRVRNDTEAAVVSLLVRALLAAGLNDLSEVGVISPFRAQVLLLQDLLAQELPAATALTIEISTVDRFQGRDKDVIIMSTVRGSTATATATLADQMSNTTADDTNNSPRRVAGPAGDDVTAGDLLRDWRRINVAVTRARKKLIIIGSPNTLEQVPLLSTMLGLMREKNWMISLPANGITQYDTTGGK